MSLSNDRFWYHGFFSDCGVVYTVVEDNGYHRSSALLTLDEKFAAGGINEAEYLQKKNL